MSPRAESGANIRIAPSTPTADGSTIREIFTVQSWLPPGRAQRWRIVSSERLRSGEASGMGKDINLVPARQVKARPVRKKIEAGLGQVHSAFADETFIQRFFHPVKITDI